ncbi:hypothetical protein JNN96_30640 [Mycobacterium sp. DSM 3803]|nr:hypothetical protein [Mycobacterium sp. DSM 3803]OKH65758.1 hypothetical protein EB73_21040 [Mycobacterium sp. SWH-M3]
MAKDVSLDLDEAAVLAQKWREYADSVEARGRTQHVPLNELTAMVGDVYAPYTDAKAREYEARQAAYQRVAEHSRQHADKLDATKIRFDAEDLEGSQRVARVLD